MTLVIPFYSIMVKTTVIYLCKDNKYLMLHRNKKKNDINKDKWIGVGGHIEENETNDECIVREVKEETNLELVSFRLCGEVLFDIDGFIELMYVYTSNDFYGDLKDCNEGTLEWIDKKEVLNLPIWEGDKTIFQLMEKEEYFKLKLTYYKDVLVLNEKY